MKNSFSVEGSYSSLNCQCNFGFIRASTEFCLVCPAGTYASNVNITVCSQCSEGKYSSSIAGVSSDVCLPCIDHSNSPAGSADIENCSCDPGYSPGILGCMPCRIGMYKSAPGNYACLNCEAGKSTDQGASVSVSSCNSCKMGMFWDKSNCNDCPAGKYSAKINGMFEVSCQLCPEGKFSNLTGSTGCLLCSDKTFAQLQGSLSCSQCPEHSDSIASMGTKCICHFPFKGIILKVGDLCSKYFEDSLVWKLGLAGRSCFETCQAVNMSCNSEVSSSLDSIQKLLQVANITATECNFVTGSGSHLAPHRCKSAWFHQLALTYSLKPCGTCHVDSLHSLES